LNTKLWAVLSLVVAGLAITLALILAREDRGVLDWPNDGEIDLTRPLTNPPPSSPGYTTSELQKLGDLLRVNDWPVRWNAEGLLEVKHEPSGLTLVLVPGSRDDGAPEESENIEAFLLSKTEVPQFSWDRAGGGDRREWEGDMLPIHGVSWLSAMDWCSRVELRLPTETEWEHACRAGTTSLWSCGDDHESLVSYGWHDRNSEEKPHPVGSLRPNAWGLHDMQGNVCEWCFDVWSESAPSATREAKPDSSRHDARRVLRGGWWGQNAFGLASGERSYLAGSQAGLHAGFRPAMSLP